MKKWLIAAASLLCLTGCSSVSVSPIHHDNKAKTVEGAVTHHAMKKSIKKPQAPKTPTVKPLYYIDSKTWSVRPINPSYKKKVVLLTFDDAPDKHAIDIATTLQKNHIHSIFFINGHFLTTDVKKNQLKQIVAMGDMLGDHTFSHPNLKDLSQKEQTKEIMSVYDQINSITGQPPKFFRAPYGVNTDLSNDLAGKHHMVVMNWSYGYDFVKNYENKEALTKIMLTTPYLYNGAILLMHDRPWTAEALQDIINGLKEKGYTFVDPHTIRTK